MPNIVDYARTATRTFGEAPLTDVDSLVFSCLAFLWIPEEVEAASTQEGMRLIELDDAALRLALTAPLARHDQYEALLKAAATSPRFFNVRVCHARENSSPAAERQFAAVSFVLPDGATYVAFRGTDNTLLGWKEDLGMAFSKAVPSQEEALAYLQEVAAQTEGPLYVGGHSKGGNLAVYATLMAPSAVRERVIRCFSHDGPGFLAETTDDPMWSGAWELVDKTMPAESLVGLLLGGEGSEPMVVESSREGIMQHDAFSWQVRDGAFVQAKALSYDTYRLGKRVNAWVYSMGLEERRRTVEILYLLVRASGEVTFSGLVQSLSDGSLSLMLQRLDSLSEEDRAFFLEAMSDLAATVILGPAPKEAVTPAERTAEAVERVDDITARFNDTMARWEKYLS